MPVAALAMLAAMRTEDVVVAELQERVVLITGDEVDAAAVAAVAAAGASSRDEFLAAKGNTAVASVSSTHGDFGFVDEHWGAGKSLIRPDEGLSYSAGWMLMNRPEWPLSSNL